MKKQIPKKWHDWFEEYSREYVNNDADVTMPSDGSDFDIADIPRYALSCMYTMRSNDWFLGSPFNIASYALLTHIIAKLVNMVPDELIASIGDCHLYIEHLEAAKEQLSRKGNDKLPKLEIEGEHIMVEDFKFEDFKIMGYEPDPPIKAPLLVG
jgi:thymidylate synthase